MYMFEYFLVNNDCEMDWENQFAMDYGWKYRFLCGDPDLCHENQNREEKWIKQWWLKLKKTTSYCMSKNYQKIEKKVLTKGFICSIMWKLLRERRKTRKTEEKNLKKVLDKRFRVC